jgi:cell division protein FtsW (lipid II flippase)
MLLKGDPRWTHRRRLVYATVGVAFTMLLVAMLDFTDRQVSSQLVIGAVSLLSIVLTAYTVTATYDDKWRADDAGSDY